MGSTVRRTGSLLSTAFLASCVFTGIAIPASVEDYAMVPPFLTNQEPPLVMLVMGRNHKLYYEAYNDASDLNEDGGLDVGYRGLAEEYTDSNSNGKWDAGETFTDDDGSGEWESGESYVDTNGNGTYDAAEPLQDKNGDLVWNDAIDYYGYFDSYKCYEYDATDARFEPTSAPKDGTGKPIKKCSGSQEWSGDFLNYLTMTRMDTMRKVLYGGYRSTDTDSSTVLERVFIPQDAHSFGKEYESIDRDGYDIRDFTPLDLPPEGTRHLFASTTIDSNGDNDGSNDPPLLRVLPNNTHRIWNWIAKERPVVDNSLEESAGTDETFTGAIDDHDEFEDIVVEFANSDHQQGAQSVTRVDAGGTNINPFMTNNDNYYITISTATLNIKSRSGYTNNFRFGLDGDDAVEVIIRDPSTGTELIHGWYGAHGPSGGNYTAHRSPVWNLPDGNYPIEFRHHEIAGGEVWRLRYQREENDGDWSSWWHVDYDDDYPERNMLVEEHWTQTFYNLVRSAADPSVITDYETRVVVCDPAFLEDNCKQYPDGNYKPTGLLQRYGESDQMMFGLISGSYNNNTQGGVLRKNIGSIRDEIDADNGTFIVPTGGGIVDTINKLRIADFTYSDHTYQNCGWITTRPVNDSGECVAWGNPIGEMMYEGVRYFAGKAAPTSDFDYSGTTIDNTLGLPKPAWIDPYLIEDSNRDGVLDSGEDVNGNSQLDVGFENCSKPFMLVLSDIYPTYDSNALPGSNFNTFTGDLSNPAMDVSALADLITSGEGTFPDNHFIGRQGTSYDGACTEKVVDDLGESRGLCPEEPTKQGSYYAASVAYYGNKYDVSSSAEGNQNITTYAVGLASPLPKININVEGHTITVVPFAKSVGGSSINAAAPPTGFQPTNTIVDFFVEKITATEGVFRVNFEDVEQGADHDMDAIVRYEYKVNADGSVDIKLVSTYAAGGIIQHMGYVISGSSADGVYLVVRDEDTNAGSDPDYFLDTPAACLSSDNPNNCWADGSALPLESTRTFYPGASSAATLLDDPLKYAAKWGGFVDGNTPTEDSNGNGVLDAGEDLNGNSAIDYLTDPMPDEKEEWDADGDNNPDSYFYVVNPLRLEEQLNKSFAAILRRTSSGTAASVISNSRSGEGAVYQSIFYPEHKIGADTLTWVGEVHGLFVDSYGYMREDSNSNGQLNIHDEDLNGNGVLDTSLNEDVNNNGMLDSGEDLNGNGYLDFNLNEDEDGDGFLDKRDLIIVFDGTTVHKYDDANENGLIDIEDQIVFDPDYADWHGNGVIDTEDTNGDGILSLIEDVNGNGIFDYEDQNGNGVLDTELLAGTYSIDDISYLWSAKEWLNEINPLTQRVYTTNEKKRYIFTFVDADGDMIVDPGEQMPFNLSGTVSVADLADTSKLFPYLTLYPSFADKPDWVNDIDTHANGNEFRTTQAERIVKYIRGADQKEVVVGVSPTADIVPAMRNRQYYDSVDSITKTWRLGDIVHSSPVAVGRPQESYHLLYRDTSYAEFVARYQSRRSVVYVGANDGMIHAFNAGFYENDDKAFLTTLDEPFTDANGDGNYDDGTETWTDSNGDGNYDGPTGESYYDADGDGHYDLPETFTDVNGNGIWDDGEPFSDDNLNGYRDPGDSFVDADGDNVYDAPETLVSDVDGDGVYDDADGDTFIDSDGDGVWFAGEEWTDDDGDGLFTPGEAFTDSDGDGVYLAPEPFDDADVDLTYDVGESYSDLNGNGRYDGSEWYFDTDSSGSWEPGEPFIDVDGDGHYDSPDSFTDTDSDGHLDNVAEDFVDLNNNGLWDGAGQTAYDLGAEIWAYVPFNQLPHLYWLTEETYPHAYYNDLQPKVFDAKIFEPEADCPTNPNDPTPVTCKHPYGWGTVMVAGMRFGGGEIVADTNNNDVDDTATGGDRTMTSAYVVFDITDPESEPKVLAEITLDGQGYTTCYPAVIPMRTKTTTGSSASFTTNDWYLVFGSGPADTNGKAVGHDSAQNILAQGISEQQAKLYVMNLNKLTDSSTPVISTINTSGELTSTSPYYIEQYENDSFISQPVSVDYNLDFNAETLYFGTINGNEIDGWGGMMRRLLINNEAADPSDGHVSWTGTNDAGVDRANNYLINLDGVESGQPITTAVAVTVGDIVRDGSGAIVDVNNDGQLNRYDRERWVFFGTGRFYIRGDAENVDQQSYYGIKEPFGDHSADGIDNPFFDGTAVVRSNLVDVSNAAVYDDKVVTGVAGVTTWNELINAIDTNDGWHIKFPDIKERNLGQAVLLGEVLTFTTYVPALDVCAFEGESWLYAPYYKTGTSFPEPIIGYDHEDDGDDIVEEGEKRSRRRLSLGKGLALTPNVHTGEEDGSKAFVQTSTGAIETIDQKNPGMTKSGKTSWLER